MSNIKKGTDVTTNEAAPAVETKGRVARKKVYERVRESTLPEALVEHFKRDNYDIKAVRWAIHGEEDYRYLNRREKEGYEFVTEQEIPRHMLSGLRSMNTKSRQGLITMGDLCLMKIDCDLRNSRRAAYQEDTDREMESVDIHVLEKKGFKNLGTKSRVMMREPTFQE